MFANEKQLKTFVELFRDGTRLSYSKNEYIIRPGESPSGIFYIESGFVKAFNISKYGEENLLIIRKEHEVFPLIWAITGEERDIVYQALSPTSVWRVSSEQFTNFLTTHPDALPPLLDMVTEMYRRHSERILNLEYRSVRERLISFLLLMAKRFGENTKDGVRIAIPLRHQDIASSINASRETASRELSYLERKELISNTTSYITLRDKKALETYL